MTTYDACASLLKIGPGQVQVPICLDQAQICHRSENTTARGFVVQFDPTVIRRFLDPGTLAIPAQAK